MYDKGSIRWYRPISAFFGLISVLAIMKAFGVFDIMNTWWDKLMSLVGLK